MNYEQVEQQLQEKGYQVLSLTRENVQLGNNPGKFTILGFCTQGSAVIEMNMERCHLTQGSRICYTHLLMSQTISVSPDFQAILLVMTDQFAFNSSIGITTETIQSLFTSPIIAINDNKIWQLMLHLMNSLRVYAELESYRPEFPQSIFRGMVQILGMSDASHHLAPAKRNGYSMADTYFRNFINLIYDHVKQEHEVAYYADQLHITSKYLNEICKLKSGHKAKEIISHILVTFIKRELLFTSKSMKELAAEFCFADQSSLGKFFRKLTGFSPLLYKNSQK